MGKKLSNTSQEQLHWSFLDPADVSTPEAFFACLLSLLHWLGRLLVFTVQFCVAFYVMLSSLALTVDVIITGPDINIAGPVIGGSSTDLAIHHHLYCNNNRTALAPLHLFDFTAPTCKPEDEPTLSIVSRLLLTPILHDIVTALHLVSLTCMLVAACWIVLCLLPVAHFVASCLAALSSFIHTTTQLARTSLSPLSDRLVATAGPLLDSMGACYVAARHRWSSLHDYCTSTKLASFFDITTQLARTLLSPLSDRLVATAGPLLDTLGVWYAAARAHLSILRDCTSSKLASCFAVVRQCLLALAAAIASCFEVGCLMCSFLVYIVSCTLQHLFAAAPSVIPALCVQALRAPYVSVALWFVLFVRGGVGIIGRALVRRCCSVTTADDDAALATHDVAVAIRAIQSRVGVDRFVELVRYLVPRDNLRWLLDNHDKPSSDHQCDTISFDQALSNLRSLLGVDSPVDIVLEDAASRTTDSVIVALSFAVLPYIFWMCQTHLGDLGVPVACCVSFVLCGATYYALNCSPSPTPVLSASRAGHRAPDIDFVASCPKFSVCLRHGPPRVRCPAWRRPARLRRAVRRFMSHQCSRKFRTAALARENPTAQAQLNSIADTLWCASPCAMIMLSLVAFVDCSSFFDALAQFRQAALASVSSAAEPSAVFFAASAAFGLFVGLLSIHISGAVPSRHALLRSLHIEVRRLRAAAAPAAVAAEREYQHRLRCNNFLARRSAMCNAFAMELQMMRYEFTVSAFNTERNSIRNDYSAEMAKLYNQFATYRNYLTKPAEAFPATRSDAVFGAVTTQQDAASRGNSDSDGSNDSDASSSDDDDSRDQRNQQQSGSNSASPPRSEDDDDLRRDSRSVSQQADLLVQQLNEVDARTSLMFKQMSVEFDAINDADRHRLGLLPNVRAYCLSSGEHVYFGMVLLSGDVLALELQHPPDSPAPYHYAPRRICVFDGCILRNGRRVQQAPLVPFASQSAQARAGETLIDTLERLQQPGAQPSMQHLVNAHLGESAGNLAELERQYVHQLSSLQSQDSAARVHNMFAAPFRFVSGVNSSSSSSGIPRATLPRRLLYGGRVLQVSVGQFVNYFFFVINNGHGTLSFVENRSLVAIGPPGGVLAPFITDNVPSQNLTIDSLRRIVDSREVLLLHSITADGAINDNSASSTSSAGDHHNLGSDNDNDTVNDNVDDNVPASLTISDAVTCLDKELNREFKLARAQTHAWKGTILETCVFGVAQSLRPGTITATFTFGFDDPNFGFSLDVPVSELDFSPQRRQARLPSYSTVQRTLSPLSADGQLLASVLRAGFSVTRLFEALSEHICTAFINDAVQNPSQASQQLRQRLLSSQKSRPAVDSQLGGASQASSLAFVPNTQFSQQQQQPTSPDVPRQQSHQPASQSSPSSGRQQQQQHQAHQPQQDCAPPPAPPQTSAPPPPFKLSPPQSRIVAVIRDFARRVSTDEHFTVAADSSSSDGSALVAFPLFDTADSADNFRLVFSLPSQADVYTALRASVTRRDNSFSQPFFLSAHSLMILDASAITAINGASSVMADFKTTTHCLPLPSCPILLDILHLMRGFIRNSRSSAFSLDFSVDGSFWAMFAGGRDNVDCYLEIRRNSSSSTTSSNSNTFDLQILHAVDGVWSRFPTLDWKGVPFSHNSHRMNISSFLKCPYLASSPLFPSVDQSTGIMTSFDRPLRAGRPTSASGLPTSSAVPPPPPAPRPSSSAAAAAAASSSSSSRRAIDPVTERRQKLDEAFVQFSGTPLPPNRFNPRIVNRFFCDSGVFRDGTLDEWQITDNDLVDDELRQAGSAARTWNGKRFSFVTTLGVQQQLFKFTFKTGSKSVVCVERCEPGLSHKDSGEDVVIDFAEASAAAGLSPRDLLHDCLLGGPSIELISAAVSKRFRGVCSFDQWPIRFPAAIDIFRDEHLPLVGYSDDRTRAGAVSFQLQSQSHTHGFTFTIDQLPDLSVGARNTDTCTLRITSTFSRKVVLLSERLLFVVRSFLAGEDLFHLAAEINDKASEAFGAEWLGVFDTWAKEFNCPRVPSSLADDAAIVQRNGSLVGSTQLQHDPVALAEDFQDAATYQRYAGESVLFTAVEALCATLLHWTQTQQHQQFNPATIPRVAVLNPNDARSFVQQGAFPDPRLTRVVYSLMLRRSTRFLLPFTDPAARHSLLLVLEPDPSEMHGFVVHIVDSMNDNVGGQYSAPRSSTRLAAMMCSQLSRRFEQVSDVSFRHSGFLVPKQDECDCTLQTCTNLLRFVFSRQSWDAECPAAVVSRRLIAQTAAAQQQQQPETISLHAAFFNMFVELAFNRLRSLNPKTAEQLQQRPRPQLNSAQNAPLQPHSPLQTNNNKSTSNRTVTFKLADTPSQQDKRQQQQQHQQQHQQVSSAQQLLQQDSFPEPTLLRNARRHNNRQSSDFLAPSVQPTQQTQQQHQQQSSTHQPVFSQQQQSSLISSQNSVSEDFGEDDLARELAELEEVECFELHSRGVVVDNGDLVFAARLWNLDGKQLSSKGEFTFLVARVQPVNRRKNSKAYPGKVDAPDSRIWFEFFCSDKRDPGWQSLFRCASGTGMLSATISTISEFLLQKEFRNLSVSQRNIDVSYLMELRNVLEEKDFTNARARLEHKRHAASMSAVSRAVPGAAASVKATAATLDRQSFSASVGNRSRAAAVASSSTKRTIHPSSVAELDDDLFSSGVDLSLVDSSGIFDVSAGGFDAAEFECGDSQQQCPSQADLNFVALLDGTLPPPVLAPGPVSSQTTTPGQSQASQTSNNGSKKRSAAHSDAGRQDEAGRLRPSEYKVAHISFDDLEDAVVKLPGAAKDGDNGDNEDSSNNNNPDGLSKSDMLRAIAECEAYRVSADDLDARVTAALEAEKDYEKSCCDARGQLPSSVSGRALPSDEPNITDENAASLIACFVGCSGVLVKDPANGFWLPLRRQINATSGLFTGAAQTPDAVIRAMLPSHFTEAYKTMIVNDLTFVPPADAQQFAAVRARTVAAALNSGRIRRCGLQCVECLPVAALLRHSLLRQRKAFLGQLNLFIARHQDPFASCTLDRCSSWAFLWTSSPSQLSEGLAGTTHNRITCCTGLRWGAGGTRRDFHCSPEHFSGFGDAAQRMAPAMATLALLEVLIGGLSTADAAKTLQLSDGAVNRVCAAFGRLASVFNEAQRFLLAGTLPYIVADETVFAGAPLHKGSGNWFFRVGGPLWVAGVCAVSIAAGCRRVTYLACTLLRNRELEASRRYVGRRHTQLCELFEFLPKPLGTVVTDELKSYRGFARKQAVDHKTVNHSRKAWVDPSGHSTNPLEAMWAVIKQQLRHIFGILAPNDLDVTEYRLQMVVWRWNLLADHQGFKSFAHTQRDVLYRTMQQARNRGSTLSEFDLLVPPALRDCFVDKVNPYPDLLASRALQLICLYGPHNNYGVDLGRPGPHIVRGAVPMPSFQSNADVFGPYYDIDQVKLNQTGQVEVVRHDPVLHFRCVEHKDNFIAKINASWTEKAEAASLVNQQLRDAFNKDHYAKVAEQHKAAVQRRKAHKQMDNGVEVRGCAGGVMGPSASSAVLFGAAADADAEDNNNDDANSKKGKGNKKSRLSSLASQRPRGLNGGFISEATAAAMKANGGSAPARSSSAPLSRSVAQGLSKKMTDSGFKTRTDQTSCVDFGIEGSDAMAKINLDYNDAEQRAQFIARCSALVHSAQAGSQSPSRAASAGGTRTDRDGTSVSGGLRRSRERDVPGSLVPVFNPIGGRRSLPPPTTLCRKCNKPFSSHAGAADGFVCGCIICSECDAWVFWPCSCLSSPTNKGKLPYNHCGGVFCLKKPGGGNNSSNTNNNNNNNNKKKK